MATTLCLPKLSPHIHPSSTRAHLPLPNPQKPSSTRAHLPLPNPQKPSSTRTSTSTSNNSIHTHKPFKETSQRFNLKLDHLLPLPVLILPLLLDPKDAIAVSGEYGLLEGRTVALIHPIVMGGLFLYTLWAGYLGWQWRRVRTVQNEINDLKKQLKPTPVTPEGSPIPNPSPSPVEAKIQQLTEERKNLVKGSYRDRHFNAGSILLAFGVFEAISGGLNTWLRTGKLFPGPHLYGGAAITVLWALAAALVPPMQKGSETARNLHIALNALNVLLFLSQIATGFDIVLKVFEFTKWP